MKTVAQVKIVKVRTRKIVVGQRREKNIICPRVQEMMGSQGRVGGRVSGLPVETENGGGSLWGQDVESGNLPAAFQVRVDRIQAEVPTSPLKAPG